MGAWICLEWVQKRLRLPTWPGSRGIRVQPWLCEVYRREAAMSGGKGLQRHGGKMPRVLPTWWNCRQVTSEAGTFLRCLPATREMTLWSPKAGAGSSRDFCFAAAVHVIYKYTPPTGNKGASGTKRKHPSFWGNKETLCLVCVHGFNAGKTQPHT